MILYYHPYRIFRTPIGSDGTPDAGQARVNLFAEEKDVVLLPRLRGRLRTRYPRVDQ